MMQKGRYALIALCCIVLFSLSVFAHKTPLIEYGKISDVLEVGYTYVPRQPVISEPITIYATLEHPGAQLKGNFDVEFTIMYDDTRGYWYGGKQYREPDFVLLKHAKGEFVDEEWRDQEYHGETVQVNRLRFKTDVVVGEPGNYQILIDVYQDGQYMGQQSMRAFDAETRTLGPLYMVFSALIILGVCFGVWKGFL